MAVRIAINGLGRIGRCVLRALFEQARADVEIVAVNGPAPIETHVHLLKYDSTHGVFKDVEKYDEQHIKIAGKVIPLFRETNPEKLPWRDLKIDVVLECTGKMNSKEASYAHIKAGAKKVIISAPADNVDATVVFGVNDDVLSGKHEVISVGSCTTNCLAPIAKVLNDKIGIVHGFMTTIHAYTNDQNILDGTHKDLRRARSAAVSMIPSKTGAAKALGLVLPELSGKLDGVSVRVPVPNVSMIDLTFSAARKTELKEINELIKAATVGPMGRVLGYTEETLVSVDFNHCEKSSVFDATGTKVVDGNFCRVAAWYDNEWGFSVRMLDVANLFGKMI